jgi:hypothetical protein
MNGITKSSRRRARRTFAIGAGLAVAAALGAGTASASPEVATSTTHETLRLLDDEHHLLYFINKSRADLCTPERLAFEQELLEWLDAGAVGDPPAEPASSQQGVAQVTRSSRFVNGRELLNIVGDDVPVEAWRLDDEEGGVDCSATDGPGAGLFASGPMDFTVWRNISDPQFTGDIGIAGTIVDPHGTRWNAEVRYLVKLVNGEFTAHGNSRLVALG